MICTIPLKPEEIVKLFQSEKVVVSVEKSILNSDRSAKYEEIFMFIKNLRKPIEICDFDDDFILAYMRSEHYTFCENIKHIVANILFWEKYNAVLYTEYLDSYNLDQIKNFVATQPQIVNRYRDFLESLPLFLVYSTHVFVEEKVADYSEAQDWLNKVVPQDRKLSGKVADLGHNVVSLMNMDNFLMHYLDQEDIRLLSKGTWYEEFFERYSFSKQNLSYWLGESSFAKHLLAILTLLETTEYKVVDNFPVVT